MLFLDIAMRGASIGLLFLLAGLLWRAPIGWEGRVSVLAVAVTKSSMLVLGATVPLDLPPLVTANLVLFSSLTPNAITWLIVTIFLDPPRRRWPWLVASTVVSGLVYGHQINPVVVPDVVCNGAAALLYGGLMVLSLWSSRDDLVECRCRARPGFAMAIAGIGMVLTGLHASGMFADGSLTLAVTKSASVLAVTLAFAIWILNPAIDRWPGAHDHEPRPAPPQPDAPDTALMARISRAMDDGIWREEGLTIGALATRLNVPEHRLRRAINAGLGYRNFSSFINRARIGAAKAQLADPENAQTTILEIAYDVGFASLGPFNRAFRAETGQSPTEFRREVQSPPPRAPADSENLSPIPRNLH